MKIRGAKVKELLQNAQFFFRTNPHLGPSIFLFCLGVLFLSTTKYTAASGALFGAGASLLGAWISDFNSRKKDEASKQVKEVEAVSYLSPELIRTIKRLIYIQHRAIVNYSMNASENNNRIKLGGSLSEGHIEPVALGDQKEDFLPYLPLLYPQAPQLQHLSGKKAVTLVLYYDSLFELEMFVKDWWKREGQLASNIFNNISHQSEKSLKLASDCIIEFGIEQKDNNNIDDNSLLVQISKSLESAIKTRERCYKDFEKATSYKKLNI